MELEGVQESGNCMLGIIQCIDSKQACKYHRHKCYISSHLWLLPVHPYKSR